jgi:hypothetical protein
LVSPVNIKVVPINGTAMFTRILTDVERKYVVKYLQRDGEKVIQVRKVVSGARMHLPKIREDLALLEKLLEAYARSKAESK